MLKYFNMEHSDRLTQGLDEIKTVANNGSWCGDTPRYWAEALLPRAYAVGCLEVVCESPAKARALYKRIAHNEVSCTVSATAHRPCQISSRFV